MKILLSIKPKILAAESNKIGYSRIITSLGGNFSQKLQIDHLYNSSKKSMVHFGILSEDTF